MTILEICFHLKIMTKNYLRLFLGGYKNYKWYSLIQTKVLHPGFFIRNKLHQGRSPFNFVEFFRILRKLLGMVRV